MCVCVCAEEPILKTRLALSRGLPGCLEGKESARSAGDPGSISGSERSPGGGHGNPLEYSCLENPMDRGAWRATVHRVAKSQTGLSKARATHTHTHTHPQTLTHTDSHTHVSLQNQASELWGLCCPLDRLLALQGAGPPDTPPLQLGHPSAPNRTLVSFSFSRQNVSKRQRVWRCVDLEAFCHFKSF